MEFNVTIRNIKPVSYTHLDVYKRQPLAQYATHLFTNNVDSLTFFNSQIPALFIAELLCTYISKKVGNKNEEKLRLIDRYTSSMELY